MAGGTKSDLNRDHLTLVFGVAAKAVLRRYMFQRSAKPGFAEPVDRVAFIRTGVAVQTLRRGHSAIAEIHRCFALAHPMAKLRLQLLSHSARSLLMAVAAMQPCVLGQRRSVGQHFLAVRSSQGNARHDHRGHNCK